MFFHIVASIIVLVSVAYMLYNAFRKKPQITNQILPISPIQK
jgi:hypothetical protein